MSVSITGKLNKAAHRFDAGDSDGFGMRIGVRFFNRKTKEQEWTNYEASIFAKKGAQSDFYRDAFVEGSVVEISGTGCQVKTFTTNDGTVRHSIAIIDAKIGYIATNDAPKAQQSQQQQQQPPQVLDDDIPF